MKGARGQREGERGRERGGKGEQLLGRYKEKRRSFYLGWLA